MEDKTLSYEELLAGIERAEQDYKDNQCMADAMFEMAHGPLLAFYKEETPWVPCLLALLWLTGGRISEILSIRGRDIETARDEATGQMYAVVTLTNLKQRGNKKGVVKNCIVPIDDYPDLWDRVEKYYFNLQNPDGLFFLTDRTNAFRKCQRYFDTGTHHTGRHSWLMERARDGTQLLDAKQMGGWTSLSSMDKYVHEFGKKELVKRMLQRKD